MRRPVSITVFALALGLAACGSGETNSPQNSAGGSGATTGGATNPSNGSGGGPATGGVGNATGGAGNPGVGGNATGGAGNPGVGGNATGGAGNPGVGGNATGGATGSPGGAVATGGKSTGGATGNPGGAAATGGKSTGGATGNPGGAAATGGKSTGGATGNPGGAAATGGSNPGGGATSTSTSTLITSASGAFWKTGTWTESTGNATVTVNDATTSQTWDGFGGAFNEKGWSYLTTQTMKDQAIQALFGKEGCNFAWGRIPIGSSDYALSRYSDDEVASGTDTAMASFSITRDLQNLIPYVKAAQAVKSNIRFWGSPWSPPTWMKTGPYSPGDGPSNSNFDGGVMKSDTATLTAHAAYLVKWIQAYAAQNIKIDIVAPQNEPNYQQNYPSCHWETNVFVNYVKILGPALTTAGLSTKVMDGTLSNTSGDSAIGSQVLQDATAKSYIGAIGVQWGMAASSQVNTLKGLAGTIPIWLSEHQCGGTMGSTAPAPNDQAYGVASWGYIRDAIKNGLTAYNAWNMVLDAGGLGIDDTRKWPQNALIVANSGSLTMTPAYHVFRHVSQFVDVGAKVVAATGGDTVAFKNPDGSLVAVMYNSGAANSSYVVSIGGKKLQFAMPAAGWATVKYVP